MRRGGDAGLVSMVAGVAEGTGWLYGRDFAMLEIGSHKTRQ